MQPFQDNFLFASARLQRHRFKSCHINRRSTLRNYPLSWRKSKQSYRRKSRSMTALVIPCIVPI